jgi:hypothetical protein
VASSSKVRLPDDQTTRVAKTPKPKKKKRKEIVLPEEDEATEDAEIAWLEYAINKDRRKEKTEDGLDDGLDGMWFFPFLTSTEV